VKVDIQRCDRYPETTYALKRITVLELRRKYAQFFGENTTSRYKEFLIRGIVRL
jgi:hypothetical protein